MSVKSDTLVLKFEPSTIQHLGVKLYSQLPLALSELISNSYDAGANLVGIWLKHKDGKPHEIKIEDDGKGMSFEEINDFFLKIGRNRRSEKQEEVVGRPPTGKKGLGKLAAFGISNTAKITSRKNGSETVFILRYSEILESTGNYEPTVVKKNAQTDLKDGVILELSELKRQSPFDAEGLANSLSKTFIFKEDFKVAIVTPSGTPIVLDNHRKYGAIDKQFEWPSSDFPILNNFPDGKITGKFISAEKPIPPNTKLRGISLFSRGKLVNAPEFFRDSTSSHVYSYLTGYLDVSFIENYSEDVISTNRQSLLWDSPLLEELRSSISQAVTEVASDWRKKRAEEKERKISEATGINTPEWIGSMPEDVKDDLGSIVNALSHDEGAEETSFIVKALHRILPEYPMLHWRHLHPEVKEAVKLYYENAQYAEAADQGAKIYFEKIKSLTSLDKDGRDLAGKAFSFDRDKDKGGIKRLPFVQINQLTTESERDQQEGQNHLSMGLAASFRNPMSHAPLAKLIPNVFTELDCLNVLSLITYLLRRLEAPTINTPS